MKKVTKILTGALLLASVVSLSACGTITTAGKKTNSNTTNKVTTKKVTTKEVTTEDLGNYCPITIGDKTYNIYQKKSPNYSCSFRALYEQYGEQEGWFLKDSEIYKNNQCTEKIDMDGHAYYENNLSSCESFEWVAGSSKCNEIANADYLLSKILYLGYVEAINGEIDYTFNELTDHYFSDNHNDTAVIETPESIGSSCVTGLLVLNPDTNATRNAYNEFLFDKLTTYSKDGILKTHDGEKLEKDEFAGECFYTSYNGEFDVWFDLDGEGNLSIEAKLPSERWIWNVK